MVWHHLQGEDFYLRVMVCNGQPYLFNSLSQLRQHHPRRVCTTCWGFTATVYFTKEFPSSLRRKRHHVHPPFCIVMVNTAALH